MATATITQTERDYRHLTYDLKTPEDHVKMYNEWAATYNDTVFGPTTDYVGPQETVKAVRTANGKLDGEILDAGCGTGLVGVALHEAGARHIDGIDVSPGMLKVADKTGTYRSLVATDMTKPLSTPTDTYDVVTCVGTFTTGHVGPDPALLELVRVLKKDGILAATIYHGIWKSDGFETEVQRLERSGQVDVLSTEITDYRRAEGEHGRARMIVLRKK